MLKSSVGVNRFRSSGFSSASPKKQFVKMQNIILALIPGSYFWVWSYLNICGTKFCAVNVQCADLSGFAFSAAVKGRLSFSQMFKNIRSAAKMHYSWHFCLLSFRIFKKSASMEEFVYGTVKALPRLSLTLISWNSAWDTTGNGLADKLYYK